MESGEAAGPIWERVSQIGAVTTEDMGLGWIMDKVRQGGPEPEGPLTRPLIWEPVSSHPWEAEEAVTEARIHLRGLGFKDIGGFRSRQRKNCELLAFYFPLAHVYALVRIPNGADLPVEMCCQFDDVFGVSVVNQTEIPTWHFPPDGTVIELPRAPLGQLFSKLLETGAGHDRETASPEFFLRQFQSSQVRRFERLNSQKSP